MSITSTKIRFNLIRKDVGFVGSYDSEDEARESAKRWSSLLANKEATCSINKVTTTTITIAEEL